ncbi:hypothetical protein [Pantoea stewartii]|uniref:hypothetical protein n=1 Tax=Pantoea stewartii TaxID=66269 RepID=UPI0025A05416|nr:hypothetical protein [Pantoea stewartii]
MLGIEQQPGRKEALTNAGARMPTPLILPITRWVTPDAQLDSTGRVSFGLMT